MNAVFQSHLNWSKSFGELTFAKISKTIYLGRALLLHGTIQIPAFDKNCGRSSGVYW